MANKKVARRKSFSFQNVLEYGNKNRWLVTLLFLGLVIRLIIATLPGFKIDVDAWFAWAVRIIDVGPSQFYSDKIWTNYTPGFLYVLGVLQVVKNILDLSSLAFYYLIKVPTIIAEVVLAFFVYDWVKEKASQRWALISAALVCFNPAFIFNSSVWGQVDGFLSLFMVLSVMALAKNRLVQSSILFALALLIKPQALALGPVYLLFLIKHFSRESLFKLTVPGLITFFLLFFPFFPTNPILGPIFLVFKMVGDYPYTSLFAYNFWGIFGFWASDAQKFWLFDYREWGILLFIFFWISSGFLYFKKRLDLFALAALATLFFYFLPTRVHERYLYPAIPFLILASFSTRSKLVFYLTVLLSFTFFIDMYYVYVYYNELFLNQKHVLYQEGLYTWLDKNPKILTVTSTLLFGMITGIFFTKSYGKEKK